MTLRSTKHLLSSQFSPSPGWNISGSINHFHCFYQHQTSDIYNQISQLYLKTYLYCANKICLSYTLRLESSRFKNVQSCWKSLFVDLFDIDLIRHLNDVTLSLQCLLPSGTWCDNKMSQLRFSCELSASNQNSLRG